MPKLTKTKPIALLVCLLAMLAVGFLPLFAGPGYESALAAGLILPATIAIAASLDVARNRSAPFDALASSVAMGGIVALVGYATTLVHGWRAGFCGFSAGTIFYALGPAMGCLLAGAWGALSGEAAALIAKRHVRSASVLFALAGPLGGILVSVARFYSSPIIFAFDPFFGFFSGAIYDTVVDDALFALFTYRLGSFLMLLGVFVAAAHIERIYGNRLRFRWLGRPGVALFGFACLLTSFVLFLRGPRLGHWQTARSIENELGGKVDGERCDIVYARALGKEQAELFARDCDAQVRAVEKWMGVRDTPRVRAFLFRDSAQKRSLMGAATTYIAKPWRREIYVQANGFPHPVLGHELAHVIAGSFTKGPFRVGGIYWGLGSNPGLVEGMAVAASPDDDEDLTPAEWSRTMMDLGILPRLDDVFALGFFNQTAAKAYTVAGAFVSYLHDRYGAEAVRRFYAGESLDEVVGKPLSALERDWHEALRGLEISPHARAIAEARFDRPSVFGRRCPHEVDTIRGEANLAQAEGDLPLAMASYERLLRLDPGDLRSRFQLATCHLRSGDDARAASQLDSLANDEKWPRAARDRARSQLADMALQVGNLDRAEHLYEELRGRTLDEDALRTLDVKLEAVRDPKAREAVVELLIGRKERGPDPALAATKLGAWAASEPTNGLPDYLLARGLLGRGLYREAGEGLNRALEKGLAIASVKREALRLRMIAACAVGEGETVTLSYAQWREEPETGGARGEGVRRLWERCGGGLAPR